MRLSHFWDWRVGLSWLGILAATTAVDAAIVYAAWRSLFG